MTIPLACVLSLCLIGADPLAPEGQPAFGSGATMVSPAYAPGAAVPAEAGQTIAPPAGPAAPSQPAYVADSVPPPAGYMPAAAAASPPEGASYVNTEEFAAAMKKFAWTKGDFTVTPYGILWANWVEEAGRTTPGNYPLYVARTRSEGNDDSCVDARSTRLGFDVLGPQVPFFDCAQSGGKVEIDFQRQIDVENKASLLLRHAYVEVQNQDFRLLFGQTWDVISPLCPGVLFYSVGWDGGNIGYRRPQFRAERYLALSDNLQFIAQGSVDTCAPSDTSGTSTTYQAFDSGWPILEGRLAARLGPRGQGCLPWEFGASAHVGDLIYDFHADTAAPGATPTSPFNFTEIGAHRRTWSLNADLRIPINQRFGVQGELFMGENLGPFLGGIGQSVDVVAYTDSAHVYHYATGDNIRSRGGWVDVWYDWTPRLHSHAGYSIDDPLDQDVTSGRIYNAFCFANISYDFTAKFMGGFEYSYWKTIWTGPSNVANSQNFNMVVKYGF